MKNTYPIYPSMLAFDLAHIAEQVAVVEDAGAAALHFDLMDGQFVPNLTFGPPLLASLRVVTRLPFWVHMMVYTPEALISPLLDAGATRLYLHPEATPHIHRALHAVRAAGLEVGVAIDPGTPILMLEPLLEMVDGVLVMSVDPGFGGQAFLTQTYRRLAELGALLRRLGVSPSVECDGGVDVTNIGALAEAGMTGAVVGTALFREKDPAGTLRRLQEAVLK